MFTRRPHLLRHVVHLRLRRFRGRKRRVNASRRRRRLVRRFVHASEHHFLHSRLQLVLDVHINHHVLEQGVLGDVLKQSIKIDVVERQRDDN